jgi:uncharacterized membrane protein YobD (UPF0266 family)
MMGTRTRPLLKSTLLTVFRTARWPFLVGAGVLLGIYFVISRGKKLIAGENEFVSGNTTIPYDAIEKINKTHFDKKGFFTITYTENGQSKELTLKDRTYDNLPAVLDHIVSKIS